jgi:DNA recombination protein Rad52
MPAAKDKTGAASTPPPSPEEQEREQHAEPVDEGEVRGDEFTRGLSDPVGKGFLSDAVVDELRQPLDPNRVRRRKGRGGGQFEYLAGHDVKRRMNEIFGPGGWSSSVSDLHEIAALEVEGKTGPGWHVGYSATVRVTVKTLDGSASYEDSGYGDGVEYGPAARITACELASKEAVTDAFKRACTYMGDQFGLILYAKGDEKARIARDANAEDVRGGAAPAPREPVRSEGGTEVPQGWPALNAAWVKLLGDGEEAEAAREWWMAEAVEVQFGHPKDKLTADERRLAGQKFTTAYLALVDGAPEVDPFGVPTRAAIQKELASAFGGISVSGPLWRLGKEETERLTFSETKEAEAARLAEQAAATENLPDDTPEFAPEIPATEGDK